MSHVKVIKDSISPDGVRITSVEMSIWRPMVAELNTHRVFSRNSSSSRARPLSKKGFDPSNMDKQPMGTLDEVKYRETMPISLVSEKPGMSGGPELTGYDRDKAYELIDNLRRLTVKSVEDYIDEAKVTYGDEYRSHVLHKAVINRYLEPWMTQKVIITSTTWDNYLAQRDHPDAQKEISVPSEDLGVALRESTPVDVGYGDWHLPFITDEDRSAMSLEDCVKVSIARCARVSYLTHDGVRDPSKDVDLFNRLDTADPPHLSPMEHVATPIRARKFWEIWKKKESMYSGNFYGWKQYRHIRSQ